MVALKVKSLRGCLKLVRLVTNQSRTSQSVRELNWLMACGSTEFVTQTDAKSTRCVTVSPTEIVGKFRVSTKDRLQIVHRQTTRQAPREQSERETSLSDFSASF